MRKRAGSVPEVSVFQTGISLSGLENFAKWTLHPCYQDESGKNSTAQMASCCFAHCIFHIISIPFNRSDTAIRVAKATIGAKVITLCFALVALFHEFRAKTLLRPFLISETGLKSLIWKQGEILFPGKRTSPANRAHVKRRSIGPFIRGKIRRILHKTRLK